MAQGQALIEHDVLWYEQPEARLAEHIEENEQHSGLLKQLFMVLDSAYARHPVQSAVLYGLLPDDILGPNRHAGQGHDGRLPAHPSSGRARHLPG